MSQHYNIKYNKIKREYTENKGKNILNEKEMNRKEE